MPAGTQELDAFVRESLLRGLSREQIQQALAQAGWTNEQASGALAGYADVAFPVPVPRARASLSAREAFLYLLLFSTLYLSAWHLGSLLFDLVNHVFPDRSLDMERSRGLGDSMRLSVATLIIAFPVFLFTSRYVGKQLKREPIARLSSVRRWLTYLTLFIAASSLIGDMTTLVYNALGGELTTRFVLKVIIVAFLAGLTFWYYLADLRREEGQP